MTWYIQGVSHPFNSSVFQSVSRLQTGLFITGDIRGMIELKGRLFSTIIIAKNNDSIQVIRTNK